MNNIFDKAFINYVTADVYGYFGNITMISIDNEIDLKTLSDKMTEEEKAVLGLDFDEPDLVMPGTYEAVKLSRIRHPLEEIPYAYNIFNAGITHVQRRQTLQIMASRRSNVLVKPFNSVERFVQLKKDKNTKYRGL